MTGKKNGKESRRAKEEGDTDHVKQHHHSYLTNKITESQ